MGEIRKSYTDRFTRCEVKRAIENHPTIALAANSLRITSATFVELAKRLGVDHRKPSKVEMVLRKYSKDELADIYHKYESSNKAGKEIGVSGFIFLKSLAACGIKPNERTYWTKNRKRRKL